MAKRTPAAGRAPAVSTPPAGRAPSVSTPPARLARLCALALALAIVSPDRPRALADIVLLRNGNEIQGEVIRQDEREVVVRFPGGTLRLARKDVREIRRQSRTTWLIEEGLKAVRRDDHDGAIHLLEEACRQSPDSLRARAALREARGEWAERLQEYRRLEDAAEVYRKILEEDPTDAEAREESKLVRGERQEGREELEEARRELRSGDGAASLWRLRAIRERYPDLRSELSKLLAAASLLEGNRRVGRGEWSEAADLLWTAATADPDAIDRVRPLLVRCQLELLRPAVEEGEFEKVGELARRGLQIDPASERLRFFLALSLEAEGKTSEAVDIYTSILEEAAPRSSDSEVVALRQRAEQRLFGGAGPDSRAGLDPQARRVLPGRFRELRTRHFVVRHRNLAVGREVARVAEQTYRDLFRRLGCRTDWRTPCEVIVHPDKATYVAEAGAWAWSAGAHQMQRYRGVLSEQRIVTYQDQPGLTAGVLQHEIAHALLTHRLNYPPSIPLWLNEGFAVSEGARYLHTHYRKLLLEERARRRLVPLGRLVASDTYPEGKGVELFYAESWGVVDWLLGRKGLPRFVRFAKDLASGALEIEPALRRDYAIASLTALQNHWLGSLR